MGVPWTFQHSGPRCHAVMLILLLRAVGPSLKYTKMQLDLRNSQVHADMTNDLADQFRILALLTRLNRSWKKEALLVPNSHSRSDMHPASKSSVVTPDDLRPLSGNTWKVSTLRPQGRQIGLGCRYATMTT
ncbi:hypothetical protein EV426DRAFT_610805 [Tirmania nivea]|nr:hypothetical protein EV426DRAFT_610805 [Tirmania nivea]